MLSSTRTAPKLLPELESRYQAGSTVTDVSGSGTALDLTLSGSYSWLSGGGLTFNGGTAKAISSSAATKVIDDVKVQVPVF